MSRSRLHTPVWGQTTCTSEKDDKKRAHRVLRVQERLWLARDTEETSAPTPRSTSNVWLFGKDGKFHHFTHKSHCYRTGCYYEDEQNHYRAFSK